MNNGASEVNNITVGPWGGQSGSRWDDGVYSGVRQVLISNSSAGIHSIQFEYDRSGHSVWSDQHGSTSGTKTDQIKLDYPTQYLVSISGYCGPITPGGPVIVRSLSLETNKRKYGPFGIEQGTPFSVPASVGMLVGFHGWCSRYLDSIGAYVKPLGLQTNPLQTPKMVPTTHVDSVPGYSKKVLSLGPWGGDGGTIFDDGVYTGVREVHITRSGGLVSIRVCYDQNGTAVWGNKHGGSGGLKLDKIVFDYPFEVLTHITGYYASTILRGPTVIKSVTFHTNKRSYGPFGDPQGFSFSSGILGAIVGFHGTNGYFVNSIGVHVLESKTVLPQPAYRDPFDMTNLKNGIGGHVLETRPQPAYPGAHVLESKPPLAYPDAHAHENRPYPAYPEVHAHEKKPYPAYPDPFHMTNQKPNEVVWGVPREPAPYGSGPSGPWGGEGGKPWDDGVYTGVKKIILTRGDAICSIQFQYVQNGRYVWSALHGIANEICTYHVKFDYPYEVLTGISGYCDMLVGDTPRRVIRSLIFHTNKAKYGPYGKTIGTYFSSENKDGKIVGFYGRSGTFLDAIGVHMQQWVSDELSRNSYPPERGGFRKMLHNIYK